MFTRRDGTDTTPSSSGSVSGRSEPARTGFAGSATAATGGQNESIIAAEDTFEGQIKTTTGVRVLGTVHGSITSERSVRIEEGARVAADITAEEVVIAGTYSGNLTCRNRVEITSSAKVSGKIDTAKMFLHEGGFFDGELHMQRPGMAAPSTREESEEARPRRSRYADLGSETSQATAETPVDSEKQQEATT
jgi:cytoskeletal protein CcmA (bactofilin family)